MVGLLAVTSWADDLLIQSLSIDEFVDQAIKVGVHGRENEWTLETAGYTRQIAFRQTDSPTLTAGYKHSRGDTYADHFDTLGDSKQSTLALNETTPLGTTLAANGSYGGVSNGGFSANITQPLYLFVKNAVARTRQEADLNFANAKDTYDSTVLSLRTQARQLYYNIMQSEESINVEQRKVNSTRKLLDVTQALVEAGKSAPVETMRAKINLQVDERQLLDAQVTRDKAILSAKDFIYFPLDQPLQFTSQLQFKPFATTLERLLDYALIHSPPLRTLERNLELAKLDLQAAQEATRPTFSINGSYGDSEIPNPFLVTQNWSWTASASWLFFDSFVTRDKVRQARIAQEVAELNLAEEERSLRVKIQSGYWDVRNEEKQITEFQNSREQARRNVDILRLRFQSGLDRIIDVFDAETDMRNLDNEYLGLLVQYNETKDQLSELIGADVETLK